LDGDKVANVSKACFGLVKFMKVFSALYVIHNKLGPDSPLRSPTKKAAPSAELSLTVEETKETSAKKTKK